MSNKLPTIYDVEHAREWLLWKAESWKKDDLRAAIKILAHAHLNHEIYLLFEDRIKADRKKNLTDG